VSDTLTRFTASLSWPLLLVAALFGAGVGYLRYQSERQGLEPVEPSATPVFATPTPSSKPTPEPVATPKPKPSASPRRPASKAGAAAALEAGDFKEAIRQGEIMRADEVVEEAYLLQALTRSIQPGRFAKGEEVLEVTLAKGGVVVGLVEGEGTRLLEQVDGYERRLTPSEVASERALSGAERTRALEGQLEAARRKLGSGAGALALHRLAYLSFSSGFRPHGTKYLREALKLRDGAILVDMFGEGDFDRLHRARSVLAGEPVEEPIARVDPEPEPFTPDPVRDPDPEPVSDPDPITPEPTPLSSDKRPGRRYERPKGADSVTESRAWKRADESYKAGLEVYRQTFGLSNRAAAVGVKAALAEFQRAQELLGPLSEANPDHYELEHRQEELAKLIIDCHRRQNIGD
jgi:hypothetical protein